jgi:hypothetical protein
MSEMGSWKLSSVGKAIIISSGVVAVEAKDPEQVADFSLRFWEIKKMLEQNPKATEYQMKKQSYMGLIRAVHDGKLDELGSIFEEIRTIRVTDEDKKRDYMLTPYTALPKNGGDLLKRKWKSKPRDISQVMAQDIEVNSDEEIEE